MEEVNACVVCVESGGGGIGEEGACAVWRSMWRGIGEGVDCVKV